MSRGLCRRHAQLLFAANDTQHKSQFTISASANSISTSAITLTTSSITLPATTFAVSATAFATFTSV